MSRQIWQVHHHLSEDILHLSPKCPEIADSPRTKRNILAAPSLLTPSKSWQIIWGDWLKVYLSLFDAHDVKNLTRPVTAAGDSIGGGGGRQQQGQKAHHPNPPKFSPSAPHVWVSVRFVPPVLAETFLLLIYSNLQLLSWYSRSLALVTSITLKICSLYIGTIYILSTPSLPCTRTQWLQCIIYKMDYIVAKGKLKINHYTY